MPPLFARHYSLLLAFMVLLSLPQASQARPSISQAPAAPQPQATSFFWYSPTRVSSLAFDPSTDGFALAGSGDAIQRTTDHGITWSSLEGWNPSDTRFSYAVTYGSHKGTFFAWGGTAVYSSTDGGESWAQLPYDINCNQITTLAVHPSDPKTLFVGTSNGFARSLDAGKTWLWSNPSVPDLCGGGPYAISIGAGVNQPNVVYAGEFYNYGGGVYRSADRGVSWQPVDTGLPPGSVGIESVIEVIVDPRNAALVYALTEHGDVYRTTNSGGQWSLFETGLPADPIHNLVLDSKHGYRLYGVTDYNIYTRADGAATWQKLALPPLPQTASFPLPWRLTIDPFDESRLALFSDNGTIVSLPVPTISALSQSSAPVDSASFPLIVTGTDFTNATTVQLNGVYRLTRFISSTQVETTLYGADLATPGKITVKVGWPGAAESVSNGLPFNVTSSALRINRISPDLATAGDASLTLTVQGREFAANAKLRWRGAVRTTTVLSSTKLTAQISAADLATSGAIAVTVANPAPDGRISNAATFMVAPQPTPVARRLRPAAATGPVRSLDISPDDAYVVYIAQQDSPQVAELYAIPVAGGAPRKLNGALPAGDSVGYFQISKDSKYVLYAQFSSVDQSSRLYSVALAGGAPLRLSAPLAAGEMFQYFLVSDDSKRVVYLTTRGFSPPSLNRIYSVPIAGGAVKTLHVPQTTDESIDFTLLSPDSARVVYTTNRGTQGLDQTYSLHSVPIAGGPAATLDGPTGGIYDANAQVTSDGQSVVYVRRGPHGAGSALYKRPIGGGAEITLRLLPPPLSVVYFYLSPDGRYAIVNGGGRLYSVRIDQSQPPVLLNPASTVASESFRVAISPDSRAVAFVAQGLGAVGATLYSAPIGGGALTQLNNLPNQLLQNTGPLLFSPNSRRILYVGELIEDPFGAEIYSVSVYSSQPPARVSNSLEHERVLAYPQLSFTPDGRLAIYHAPHRADDMFSLYVAPADGHAPARSQTAPVPMVAGPPALDDPDPAYEVTGDSRHVVFLGGPYREGVRDLYISDLPLQQASITPAGGTITFEDGMTLTFPPNAVTKPISISLTPVPVSTHPLPGGTIPVLGFVLEAHDGAGHTITQFAQPYTLRVTYTEEDLAAAGVNPAGLNLAFWNGSAWVAVLPCAGCAVDAANKTVTVKLNHFTEFSLNAAAHGLFLPVVRR